MEGDLTGGETAAHHDYLLTHLVQIVVGCHDVGGVLGTLNGGGHQMAAHSHDDDVGLDFVQQLLGDHGVQTDVGAALGGFPDEQILEVAQVDFIFVHIGEVHGAAQLAGLLHQHSLVTALGAGDGSLQTAGAAAHDEHLAAALGIGHGLGIPAKAGVGVDGAAAHGEGGVDLTGLFGAQLFKQGDVGGMLAEAGIAGEAAHAAADGVLLTVAGLVGELGVGKALTGQLDEVGLTGGQHFLAVLGAVEAAHHGHLGDLHRGLDLGGVLHIDAVGIQEGGEGVGAAACPLQTVGHMDDVHQTVDLLAELHGVVNGHAAGLAVLGGEAQLDDAVLADAAAAGVDDHLGESGAVLHGAAELVGAVVGPGGDELLHDEAVAAVDQNAVKAALLGKAGDVVEVVADLLHHGQIQRLDLHTVLADVSVGAPGGVGGIVLGAGALMAELEVTDRAVLLDAVGVLLHGLEVGTLELGEVHVVLVEQSGALLGVDRVLTGGHTAEAALGTVFHHAVDIFLHGRNGENGVGKHGGSGHQAVAVGLATDGDGLKYMGELGMHGAGLLSLFYFDFILAGIDILVNYYIIILGITFNYIKWV